MIRLAGVGRRAAFFPLLTVFSIPGRVVNRQDVFATPVAALLCSDYLLGVSPQYLTWWGLKESANHHLVPGGCVKSKVGVKELTDKRQRWSSLENSSLDFVARVDSLYPDPYQKRLSTWTTALAEAHRPFSPSQQWYQDRCKKRVEPTVDDTNMGRKHPRAHPHILVTKSRLAKLLGRKVAGKLHWGPSGHLPDQKCPCPLLGFWRDKPHVADGAVLASCLPLWGNRGSAEVPRSSGSLAIPWQLSAARKAGCPNSFRWASTQISDPEEVS